jgi:hypothetical protein
MRETKKKKKKRVIEAFSLYHCKQTQGIVKMFPFLFFSDNDLHFPRAFTRCSAIFGAR